MNCPSCGTPAVDGDQFCGNCGASLTQPVQPAVQQPAQQTQQMPAQASQQQPGAYQSPTAAALPPPPSGGSAGIVIALAVIGMLLFAGLAIGGFFLYRSLQGGETLDTVAIVETGAASTAATQATPTPVLIGYATVEEAVEAAAGGWVYDMLGNYGDSMEYVIGPPNSEYTDVLVLEKQSDGSWLVTRSYVYDTGSPAPQSASAPPVAQQSMTAEDEATSVIGEFLYAIKQNRPNDAHALTISPFADDPASAQYSDGDLKSIEVLSATLQGDGTTVWVRSREVWTWGTEEWIYICVPTNSGYRISNLTP